MRALADTSRIGEVIGGKYRIVRLLAKGGMGLVYEAQHTVVRRRFAVKLLRRDLAERRDILTRFQREAEAAGALENENVAAAVDFGIADDGTPYIVMEYLVGESLEALLEREGRLPVTRAAELIVQACRGVAAAHAADIVHRDLKPQNLFVSRRDDGTDLVKVLDFGVAKLQALNEASAATRTGSLIGTVAYMSPEQARGEKTVDARADVYALGAIFYELVSQQRPHPGTSQNAILHHIATHPAVPISSVQPGLPAALAQTVDRALASDLGLRPPSAEALGRALAPFARRQVWPAPSEDSGPGRLDMIATMRAEGDDRDGEASASGSMRAGPSGGNRASTPREPGGRLRSRALLAGGLLVAVLAAAAVVVARRVSPPAPHPVAQKHARRPHRLDPGTRFLSSDPPPGAVAQIASLLKANDTRDAALLSAMVATPAGIWFVGGSPEQVRAQVSEVITRAERRGRMPVLVASQRPFRNCAGYEIMGAVDTAAYEAWIDGFVAGIGNEPVIVLLEPNGLGLIPHGNWLDGTPDDCKPMLARADGRRVAAPGATPEERYLQLNYAVDALAAKAPNAAVYLDGTHSDWLPIGDTAYRLARAGVDRTAGFFLNLGNFQSTRRSIQYGTAIAKCIYYARTAPPGAAGANRFTDCPGQPHYDRQPEPRDPIEEADWGQTEAWYADHVDRGAHPPSGTEALTHFVINTNRNGRGPLDVTVYQHPPYNQPPAVIEALHNGAWCMPPGRGVGALPTPTTGVPLVDAYLWAEMPGICNASCDIAGGARAWDYSRYNPWGIAGEAQNQFDPLWAGTGPQREPAARYRSQRRHGVEHRARIHPRRHEGAARRVRRTSGRTQTITGTYDRWCAGQRARADGPRFGPGGACPGGARAGHARGEGRGAAGSDGPGLRPPQPLSMMELGVLGRLHR